MAELAQYLELELGTILLAQEAIENKFYIKPIDNSDAYKIILDKTNKNTLGASLKRIQKKLIIKENLFEIMDAALKARNRFTHHIFREFGLDVHTSEGRNKMLVDVCNLRESMQKAYNIASPIAERLVVENLKRVKENSK